MLKNYPGSKGANGAWQKIISQLPRMDRFIEVMAGSAQISQRLKTGNVKEIILNDIDGDVIQALEDSGQFTGKFKFHCADWQCIIDNYDNVVPRTVFYFDPPYLMATRSDQQRLYKYEWGQLDHVIFLDRLKTIRSNCLVSHYPCQLYDEALATWRRIYYNSMTRGGVRRECLYLNYEVPPLLADPSNVGENFTDRQRIKRKVTRLINRLNKEQPLERSAILSYVIDNFDYLISDNPQLIPGDIHTEKPG